MRHETCLNCRAHGDGNLRALTVIAEFLSASTHHHHTITCGGCGAWWFDDVVISGFGIPVAVRRDTEMCDCADGRPQYTESAIQVPQPETQCSCTKAQVEELSIHVRVGNGRAS